MAIAPTQIMRPDPDPTLLTTENLRREIANLKEMLLAQATADRSLVLAELNATIAVTQERFIGIATQFLERDKRTDQLSLADKTAVAAALQAAKEAVGAQNISNSVALTKMEDNFTKLIDQGQAQLQLMASNLDDKINDLKARIDTGEGQTRGKTEGIGMIGALIVGMSFVISSIIAVVGFVLSHSGTHGNP
jgi:hypothetical protein